MEKILNYSIIKKISETKISSVYLAKKDEEDTHVIIKHLRTDYSSQSDIARFKHEYELLKNLDLEEIIKIIDVVHYENGFVLVQENYQGMSLKKYNNNKKFDLLPFLKIAIKLSKILGDLHKKNIVHKNIKPHAIIINPHNDLIKVTDFGIDLDLTYTNKDLYNTDVIENTLAYISPEQTGRMNRLMDYRTDLYSLGITFYELITGIVPFKFNDPMELIHAHIAKEPVPPHKIDESIPLILSEIIMKLLEKSAEERYQNSFGLMADLDICLKQFEQNSRIDSFELGCHDISIKFNIPQRLYGREKELQILMRSFEKVRDGEKNVVFVQGGPGIGKSALINGIHKQIIENGRYFVSGKYDQFKREVPYSSIIYAFQSLVKQILTENKERINSLKEKLLAALGSNGQVIINVIPELELIIGKQPPVHQLGPEESQNRFNHAFKEITKIFASEIRPLVLFLDDLQWADYASLNLLKMLIIEHDIKYILFIGSYRDNEIPDYHILKSIIEEIDKEDIIVNKIILAPLNEDAINSFTANFLRCNEDQTRDLSKLISQKTNGNPFFVNQFFKTLYDEKIITIDPISGWIWDYNEIREMQVTDNVVELLEGKISRLPENVKNILKVCACIGNRFDLEILSAVTGKNMSEVLSDLSVAINEGFIGVTENNYYIFHHDRIQEAAYSLIPDEEMIEMHFRIGNYVLQNTSREKLNDKILFIVNHLNLGYKYLKDAGKIIDLIELNIIAGEKTKASIAYDAAVNYFKFAHSLLPENCWESEYALTLKIYMEIAVCEHVIRNFDEAEKIFDILIEKVKTDEDLARIYYLKMTMLSSQGKHGDAVALGRTCLKLFDMTIPKNPTELSIAKSVILIKLKLRKKDPEFLLNMPVMTDKKYILLMKILIMLITAAYYFNTNLMLYLSLLMLKLTLKYGNAPESAFAYIAYAGVLSNGFGDYQNGNIYGKLALQLNDKFNNIELRSRIIFLYGVQLQHWVSPLREVMDNIRKALKLSFENGDVNYIIFILQTLMIYALPYGEHLDELYKIYNEYIDFLKKLKEPGAVNYYISVRQFIRCLKGETKSKDSFDDDDYNDEIHIKNIIDDNIPTVLQRHYQLKSQMFYIMENFEEAVKTGAESEKLIKYSTGQHVIVEHYFYYSLALASLCISLPKRKIKKYIKIIKKNQKRIKKLADICPENFLHKYLLVEAELEKINSNDKAAIRLYKEAISAAKRNAFIHVEATANECFAKYYIQKGYDDMSERYIKRAHYCYIQWGAIRKANDLYKKYSYIIGTQNIKSNYDSSGILDIATIMKVAQTLSREIELNKLIETILRFSIENAGADKGFIIIENEEDNNLYIKAKGTIDTIIMESVPLEGNAEISSAIIHYVNRTKENLLLNNASEEGIFTNDPYIMKNRSKSILCAPVRAKSGMLGIIYLENNLIANAFNDERLTLLRILSSQAAISIENAKLYAEMEQKVIDRTATIEKQKIELEKQKAELERSKDELESDIQLAQKIQHSLLPQKLPHIKNAIIAYKYVPMMSVGGDFLDIFYDKDSDNLGLFICDVSGHGVAAALIASMVKMSLHSWNNYADRPADFLLNIRNEIKGKMGNNFITANLVSLNLNNGRFLSVNAGHPPIIIYRNGGIEIIKSKGRLINDFFEPNFEENIGFLNKYDKVIMYTDGVIEPKKECNMLNNDVFYDLIKKNGYKTPQELCQIIYDYIIDITNDQQLEDDFTIMILQYR